MAQRIDVPTAPTALAHTRTVGGPYRSTMWRVADVVRLWQQSLVRASTLLGEPHAQTVSLTELRWRFLLDGVAGVAGVL